MHTYNYKDLYNKYVQQQAEDALHEKCIVLNSHKNIVAAYATNLYTPNYFIRIALGALTVIAVLFGSMLLGLFLGSSVEQSMIALCIFFGLLTYAALEWLVKTKVYYNAGIDNILMLFCMGFISGAFLIDGFPNQAITVFLVAAVLCLWLAIRFTDSFMAMCSYLASLAVVFLLFIKAGPVAKATAPFLMMVVSVFMYALMARWVKSEKTLFYRQCLRYVSFLTLLSFYASCNYYVVLSGNATLNDNPVINAKIPLSWLFWTLTMIVPPAYIYYGIRKKDLLFIRCGLALVVVSVLTFRYFFAVLPAEIAMLTAGALMATIAYLLTRYLQTPRFGFAFDKTRPKRQGTVALETIILIETAARPEAVTPHTEFGGGSFGGGGGGSSY